MTSDNSVLHVSDSVTSLLSVVAEFFVGQSAEAVRQKRKFSVALSGGNSPAKLYTLLASKEYRERIAWENILFFFGDERFVPPQDPQSNYRMAKETLFDSLRIPPHHIIAVNTSVSPSASARMYEQAIWEHLAERCAFDLILLGLGDNAHTASLFPHTDILDDERSLVREVFVKELDQYRITFTAPLINRARVIAFLVYGAGKADAVYNTLRKPFNPHEYPAQLIRPESGAVHWFLDKAAASRV